MLANSDTILLLQYYSLLNKLEGITTIGKVYYS